MSELSAAFQELQSSLTGPWAAALMRLVVGTTVVHESNDFSSEGAFASFSFLEKNLARMFMCIIAAVKRSFGSIPRLN
jgi:hypothetical protein